MVPSLLGAQKGMHRVEPPTVREVDRETRGKTRASNGRLLTL